MGLVRGCACRISLDPPSKICRKKSVFVCDSCIATRCTLSADTLLCSSESGAFGIKSTCCSILCLLSFIYINAHCLYLAIIGWACCHGGYITGTCLFCCLFSTYAHRFVSNTFERNYKATIGVDFEVQKFYFLNKQFDMKMYGHCRWRCWYFLCISIESDTCVAGMSVYIVHGNIPMTFSKTLRTLQFRHFWPHQNTDLCLSFAVGIQLETTDSRQ